MGRGAGARLVCILVLAQLCLAGDCVDGVTPDCSDAATPCGPDLDGATFDAPVDAPPPADAQTDRTTPANDAADDVDAASADASDG